MQAILYIAHGSRLKAGVQEAIQFIERFQPTVNHIQEICFLELAHPTIEEGIAQCVAKGATKIAMIPILLLTAVHAKQDIPLEIEAAKNKYPDVTFTYGTPFGIHSKIMFALYDRIMEQHVPIQKDAQILLVGRGSSDPDVKRDLSKIAKLLEKEYQFEKVHTCFLYGAKPHFNEALEHLQAHNQVFIIPYLLFTGLLMNDIQKKLADMSNPHFVLCESLGYHPNLQEVLREKVFELLEGNQAGQPDMNGSIIIK